MRYFKLLGAWLLMSCSVFGAEEELFLNFEFQLKKADDTIISRSSVRAMTEEREITLSAAIKSPLQSNLWQIDLGFYPGSKSLEVEVSDLSRVSHSMHEGNSSVYVQTLFETTIPFQGYGDHLVFEMDGTKFHVVITLVDGKAEEAKASGEE